MTTLEKIRAEICEERSKHNMSCLDCLDIIDKYAEQEPCEDAVSIDVIIEWLKSKDIIKMSNQEKNARKELQALFSVQPKQECEDAVSREQAKQAIRDKFKTLAERCEINEVLNSLPSVQTKQKTGLTTEEIQHFEKLAEHYNKQFDK